ncbi:MAG TPA: response regulator [Caldimonas sp.]|jgi:CheY-like chemotaxis protein|nr:response regulator [Caldimonas sp.]
MPPPSPSNPLRLLVVVENEDDGRAVASRLGAEFAAGVRTSLRPDQAVLQAYAHRAEVVVLGLASIDAVERIALALHGAGVGAASRPFLLALCDGASVGAAARLCQDGVLDDYVQQFPTPNDADRLATSVRVAARIAAPLRAVAADERGAAAPARRPLVLVVEDDEVLHTLVAAMLESEQVDLVFEADGAVAVDRIRAVGPDLVLMDVMLPGGDGVALTEQIKAAPDLAAIPVVMLTGEARLATLVRSMEAGAADFIVKPFTREALLAKLNKYLPASA